MKFRILLLLFFSSVFITCLASAVENKGAKDMELYGGSRGKVPFPHHIHQTHLGDCNICHALFLQRPGSIEELKAQEKLKKKQVMNKLCIKCHKAEKKAGNDHGPTTCSKCHMRK